VPQNLARGEDRLPQPHGFQGLLAIREHFYPSQLAFAQGKEVGSARVSISTPLARPRPDARMNITTWSPVSKNFSGTPGKFARDST
jgi:hypothetical protein